MSVHVGEIHTDVVPTHSPEPSGDRGGPPPPGAVQDVWRRLQWELGRDRCRTVSEGFDD